MKSTTASSRPKIGVISRWETGERTPKPEQVAQILTTLGVNGERYDQIMTLAYGTNEAGNRDWTLESYRDMFSRLIAELRAASPTAAILVIGPPDRQPLKGLNAAGGRHNLEPKLAQSRADDLDVGLLIIDDQKTAGVFFG